MSNTRRTSASHPAQAAPASRRGRAAPAGKAAHRVTDTVAREGDLITFAPTGEQVRITAIRDGEITFEKLP